MTRLGAPPPVTGLGAPPPVTGLAAPPPVTGLGTPPLIGSSASPLLIGVAALLLLLVVAQTRPQAQTASGVDQASGFDESRIAAVYTEALGFIAPRIIDPVPLPRLTMWGLQGLTAIDPDLRVVAIGARLQLLHQDHVVFDAPTPPDTTEVSWAGIATSLSLASYQVSPPIRHAGEQAVIQGFFDQMLDRLDPYSRYVPPVSAKQDQAGLGLEVRLRGRSLEVGSVARDSPAALAGLRPGDRLAGIDGQRTKDQDPATISALLAGREGSSVTLSWRGRDGRSRDARLVRAKVPAETVFTQRVAGVLVLRITGFTGSTASHLALSIQDALAAPHPVDGIVLDLRDNHGGLVRQAVTAADTFLPAGLVASAAGRDPDALNVWRSQDGELAENVPLIILVDGRTASAAEILAAALADRGRAVVIGSATVGKGMVQTIDPLPDGGELFVTWSQILAPLGWPIQGIGVLPQLCTSLGLEMLGRQIVSLANGEQPMAEAIHRARAARIPVLAAEAQAIRALCPAAEGGAADLLAARMLIGNPAAYAAALLPWSAGMETPPAIAVAIPTLDPGNAPR